MKPREFARALGLPFILTLSIVLAGYAAVQASAASEHSTSTREVLCLGIVGNVLNQARDDARIIELCAEVGVRRSEFPPTETA